MDKSKLFGSIQESWGPDTCISAWHPDVPMYGQCAVTALVVQDYLGGVLLRCKTIENESHYWNRISTGQEIDLTYDQFNHIADTPLYKTTIIRDRQYVLSFPETEKRYRILMTRVIDNLK